VDRWDFDRLLARSPDRAVLRSYLVYRTSGAGLRGAARAAGFRVYRRGDRPGSGKTRYLVRVLSDGDPVDFEAAGAEVAHLLPHAQGVRAGGGGRRGPSSPTTA